MNFLTIEVVTVVKYLSCQNRQKTVWRSAFFVNSIN